MSSYWSEFAAIALAHLFAVASPGPDFAVVMRQCVTAGTRAGVWTALGVGSGILLHVAYCILGVALLLSSSPALFDVMKFAAALYLAYLGVRSISASLQVRPAPASAADAGEVRPLSAIGLGFLTNGLNPKATLFFLALFAVVIDPQTPLAVQLFYGAYLAVATFAWFALLSAVLGHPVVRQFLLRSGVWFERGMGVVLLLLAAQIAFNAV